MLFVCNRAFPVQRLWNAHIRNRHGQKRFIRHHCLIFASFHRRSVCTDFSANILFVYIGIAEHCKLSNILHNKCPKQSDLQLKGVGLFIMHRAVHELGRNRLISQNLIFVYRSCLKIIGHQTSY